MRDLSKTIVSETAVLFYWQFSPYGGQLSGCTEPGISLETMIIIQPVTQPAQAPLQLHYH